MNIFRLSVVALCFAICIPELWAKQNPETPDLIVYGATASGVVTAYTAARQGLKVVLLEPGFHIGGMVTGGLSASDVAYFPIIGGYARRFYAEAAAHYGVHTLSTHEDWLSEPHVGEEIFNRWIRDSGVELHLHSRLKEKGGVAKKGTHVVSITLEDGTVWRAKVFADCTYEGDLMAQAGINYIVGREGVESYGESLAGVREDTPLHQFRWKTRAYDSNGHLLPEISPFPMAANGTGDKKVQAYNFRLILTNNPANRLPWVRPAGYDASRFELLLLYIQLWKEHTGHNPTLKDVTLPVMLPNHKADFNNQGAFSTDYIGKSWSYPSASYAQRRRIWEDHMLYTQSFFYFLSSDPRVPASLREELNQWGRAKDEFIDSDHWPFQLYIREGRRMIGQYVMHQADLQTDLTKPDSIAMGSYNSDSHNVERVALKDGSVRNEGDMQVPAKPYEISFRAVLPKESQTDNLLVPVCLSASHVAYSSVRMEPQYMMIGQAAGDAAWLSITSGKPVGKISIRDLQSTLHSQGGILHLSERDPMGPDPPK